MIFDVRFLTNPHYDPKLRPLDGRQDEIGNFIAMIQPSKYSLIILKNCSTHCFLSLQRKEKLFNYSFRMHRW